MSEALRLPDGGGPLPGPPQQLPAHQVLAPRLRVGDRVRMNSGALYEVVASERQRKKFKRIDNGGGATVWVGNLDLVDKFASGELVIAAPAWLNEARARHWNTSFEARSENAKRLAYMRLDYAEAIIANRERGYPLKVGAVLDQVWERRGRDRANQANGEQKPCLAAVYLWVAIWEKDDGTPRTIKRLAFAEDDRGPRGTQLHETVVPFVKEAIRDLWFSPQRHRVSKVHDRVVTEATKANVPESRIPHSRTIRRLIERLPPFVVARERLGRRAADHTYKSVGQMQEATLPGEVYEVDAHKLDLFGVENRTRWPLGRVWVTLVIDRCTRMLVGFHLHVEPPSSLTIAAALRNAFAPKTYMLRRWPEIDRQWVAWGLPHLVVMDNGLENKARFLTEALDELGVNWLFAKPRTPEEKAYVERVLGTLARSFSPAIPGATWSNPRERGDYDTAGMACMTMEDIDELLHRWVVAYNLTFHQTIRAIPEQRWLELSDGEVAPYENILALDALLGDFAERTLTRKGIYLVGLRYGDRGDYRPLEALLARRGHDGQLRVRVRFDRTDLSFVWVQDPDTRAYLKVASLDPDYTNGLSLARHRVIRARAVEKASGYVSIAELCKTRDDLQRRIDELAGGSASTMTERKFAAIWAGLGAKGSWNDIYRLTEDEYGRTEEDARPIVDLLETDEAGYLDEDDEEARAPEADAPEEAPRGRGRRRAPAAEQAPAPAEAPRPRQGLRAEAEELGMELEGVDFAEDAEPEPEPVNDAEPNPPPPAADLTDEMAELGMDPE